MYRAIDLSFNIVSKCIAEHHPIGNLHLQRILFNIQKCFIQQQGEPAFYDEIEAWPIGPVVPEVYNHYFPRYGAIPITHVEESYLLCPEDVGCINSIIEHIREKGIWVDKSILVIVKDLKAHIDQLTIMLCRAIIRIIVLI